MRYLVVAAALIVLMTRPGAASAIKDGWFTLDVDGTPATGYAVAPQGKIEHLVVVAHGHGHGAAGWIPALERIASHGALAVAMDYSKTFVGVARGADETAAAARWFRRRVPTIRRTILVGVSMGAVPSSMAIAENPGLFNQWIAIEPVTNLVETYGEAKTFSVPGRDGGIAAEIEAECGGTPATQPAAYEARSAVARAAAIAAGVSGVTLVHAYNDGLVPWDQSRELATLLAQNGVPVAFSSVVGRDCRTNGNGNTTITGYSGQNPFCLAGHAREILLDHIIMRTGLGALEAMLAGAPGPVGVTERIIDEP